MSDNQGYIIVPRTLLTSYDWKGLRPNYQRLFLVILENAAFRPQTFSYNGNTINILPGQLCISFRRLTNLYNEGIKFKEDEVSQSFIQRALHVFAKVQFAIHQPIQGITLITITQSEICDHFKKQSDTAPDKESIRTRYTNEEREERKETFVKKETNKERSAPVVVKSSVRDSSLSKKRLEARQTSGQIVQKHKLNIKEETLDKWVRKHDPKDLLAQLDMLTRSKGVRNHESWMEKALQEDYAGKDALECLNRDFAKDFKSQTGWTALTITKKYCRIEGTDKDLIFAMAQKEFESALFANFKPDQH